MPTDWQRALTALSATVVTAAVVGLLYWARAIFVPVTMAIFLSFVLSPVVARLQRRGLGRTPAVVLTVGLVVCCSMLVGAVIVQQVAQLANKLPDRKDQIKQKVIDAKQWVVGDGEGKFATMVNEVSEILISKPESASVVIETPQPGGAMKVKVPTEESPEAPISPPEPSGFLNESWVGIQRILQELKKPAGSQVTVNVPKQESTAPTGGQFDAYLGPAAEAAGQAAFTFILTVYMLLRREDLRNRMIRLLGAGKVTTTTKAVDDASRRISKYLFSQLMVNTAFGVVIAGGLLALDVKYSVLWGFIATLMRYVPYIGTWIGLIPPVLYSVATAPAWGGGWGQPVAVLALFLGLEAFCNNVIEPRLYGQSMGLSEVAQLVAAAFWAFLWGPIGLILSGPLTVCLLVLGRHVGRYNFLVVMLGDEPVLEPRVAFYQRLAARDQDEAADVAEEAAKKSNPKDILDTVIVPALSMARRDHAEGDLDKADLHYVTTAAREIAEGMFALAETPVTVDNPAERVRVLVCPSQYESEHVAADLLALTLDPNRWEVKVTGDETLASELVEQVIAYRPAAVVLASMPPGGLAHVRYLLARLRQRCPEVKLLVGRWGAEEYADETHGESIKYTDGVDRTIAATRRRLGELHYQFVSAQAENGKESETKKALVGTTGA